MEKSRQVIIPLDQADTLFLLELGARIKIDLDQMLITILFFSSSQTHSSGDQGTERETHHRLKHPSAPEVTRVRREAHLQTTETSQRENHLQSINTITDLKKTLCCFSYIQLHTYFYQVVYFVNSGSESNDLAMLMARLYTGNYDIISMRYFVHEI